MTQVGAKEKATQGRVVKLFRDTLDYRYLGSWIDRPNNRNVEPDLLRPFLEERGCPPHLVERAIFELQRAANDASLALYYRNRALYDLLRYGVKIKPDASENTITIWPIDWETPANNHFAIAEEVTVSKATPEAFDKRPDIVLYVNGIALAVLELKRSTVSVAQGIRQNLDNQKPIFSEHFFSTIQLVMAGNDTEGLRYATIQTPEKYYLTWKEPSSVENPLDRALTQLCSKDRLLELIHDFIVFDAGTKKIARHNQYFAVRAAQQAVQRRQGGIIWQSQGSGKSLIMIWLAKWIREHVPTSRILIVTDRDDLDEQIETFFLGVDENIYRTTSGADLIARLDATTPAILCSLIHKFGSAGASDEPAAVGTYLHDLQQAALAGFRPKGDIFVFVDECHRTQSGDLHDAMKSFLPNAMFIGFTGTPLLRADQRRTIEVFGPYIHTYKFDEAVRDGVVLDLRYEARDIDQDISSQAKIDQWFDAKTKGLTSLAKAQLKARWGTMRRVLSSSSRLARIVDDILMDMATRPRLMDDHGNAMLVCGSIYQACQLYDMFDKTDLAGKCAIVTSYRAGPADIKGEETGEGATERLLQYDTYKKMLAGQDPNEFETAVKTKFIKEPGQMKLLLVVDKLLTGFDAPSATYLYIDKPMRDHALFQAICRVNRLDGEDKEYGFIVDYRDLFKSLAHSIRDYTSGALDAYDREDVAGLLKDRLEEGRNHLEEALEQVRALCEPVEPPKDTAAYFHYFCAQDSGNAAQLQANEPRRLALYKFTATLLRAYASLANELEDAGLSPAQAAALKDEVAHYESVRDEIKLASHDYIDLKLYEPAMRHLIDTYIGARDSQQVSAFDELSLIQLIVERGVAAIDALPHGIRNSKEAVAETIENNVRKVITDEEPVNPKYYEQMSQLLDALIRQRKLAAIDYETYLARIVDLARKVDNPGFGLEYPTSLNTRGKRALYDNLHDEALANHIDEIVRNKSKDGWRDNVVKEREVKYAVGSVISDEKLLELALQIIKNQPEY